MQLIEKLLEAGVETKEIDASSYQSLIDGVTWIITPISNKAVNKSNGSVHYMNMLEFFDWKVAKSVNYPKNHRKTWEEPDTQELRSLIQDGLTYRQIAEKIERIPANIIPMCYRVQGLFFRDTEIIDKDARPIDLNAEPSETEEKYAEAGI